MDTLINSSFKVGCWSEQEFFARRACYEDLLDRSDADRLFLSWRWLREWWCGHKELYGLKLKVIHVHSPEGRLVGVAPLTLRAFDYRGGFTGTRMEPLGNVSGASGAALSENISFVVDRRMSREVNAVLVKEIFGLHGWDDLFFSFIPVDADCWKLILESGSTMPGIYAREPDYLVQYVVDLREGFRAYLDKLGSKTRLKLFNARSRLEKHGRVDFVVADKSNLEHCLGVLDQLHVHRRDKVALFRARGSLYRRMSELGAEDGSVSLSYLALNGKPLSAALNLRAGRTEYGIVLAVGGGGPRNVSPGYLHIGHILERGADAGIDTFDLLAGKGDPGDYRRHLNGETSTVGGVQVIRNKIIAAAYRAVDRLRGLRKLVGV